MYGKFKTSSNSPYECWTSDLTSEESMKINHLKMRCKSAICVTAQGLLAVGGKKYKFVDQRRMCDLLDPTTLTWNILPDASMDISHATTVGFRDGALILDGSDWSSIMLILKLTTRKWKMSSRMLNKVIRPAAAAIDSSIFILSNSEKKNEVSFQCYGITADLWIHKSLPPDSIYGVTGARAQAVGRKIFVVGGIRKLCLSYCISSDNWSILSQPLHRHCHVKN